MSLLIYVLYWGIGLTLAYTVYCWAFYVFEAVRLGLWLIWVRLVGDWDEWMLVLGVHWAGIAMALIWKSWPSYIRLRKLNNLFICIIVVICYCLTLNIIIAWRIVVICGSLSRNIFWLMIVITLSIVIIGYCLT